MSSEYNSRYIAYLKTTSDNTTYGYIEFIGDMKTKYLKSKGRSLDYLAFDDHIDDHDEFTKFIEETVDSKIKDLIK